MGIKRKKVAMNATLCGMYAYYPSTRFTMKLITYIVFALPLLIYGCNDSSGHADKQGSIDPNDSIFIVQKGPFHFSMCLPKDLVGASLPIILFKEQTGELVVSLNERVSFVVTQELLSLKQEVSRLKEQGEDIFKVEIVESKETSLLYKTFLPDDTPVSYQFKSVIDYTSLPYLMRTDATKKYNLEDVKVVAKIAQSVSPL